MRYICLGGGHQGQTLATGHFVPTLATQNSTLVRHIGENASISPAHARFVHFRRNFAEPPSQTLTSEKLGKLLVKRI